MKLGKINYLVRLGNWNILERTKMTKLFYNPSKPPTIIKYNFYTVCRRNRSLGKGGRIDVGVGHCLGNFGPSEPGLSD